MSVVWSMKLFKADANKVYADLEKIKEKTPQNIVDYAEKHPLGLESASVAEDGHAVTADTMLKASSKEVRNVL